MLLTPSGLAFPIGNFFGWLSRRIFLFYLCPHPEKIPFRGRTGIRIWQAVIATVIHSYFTSSRCKDHTSPDVYLADAKSLTLASREKADLPPHPVTILTIRGFRRTSRTFRQKIFTVLLVWCQAGFISLLFCLFHI